MPIETLPRLGLGTVSDAPEKWTEVLPMALDVGYRHIDTAQMYGNEQYVGQGIAASSVDRDELFVATKTIYREPFENPDRNVPADPTEVGDAIDRSLERLGLTYVDLFYVHWPAGVYEAETIWPRFEQALENGKTRHIGVANFTPALLDEARSVLDVPIAAHQVEYHPLLKQDELLEYAQRHDHWLVAYAPLARGKVFELPEIQSIAKKHRITPAQVSLAWLLSKDNVAVIPKSSDPVHLQENLDALDIELGAEDIARIDGIDQEHRIVDPEYAAWR